MGEDCGFGKEVPNPCIDVGDVVAPRGRSKEGTPPPRYWNIASEVGEWCEAVGVAWEVCWGRGSGVSTPTASSMMMHLASMMLECNGSPSLSRDSKNCNHSGTH